MKKLIGLAVLSLVVWNLFGCGQNTSTLGQQQNSGGSYSYSNLSIEPGDKALLLGSSEIFTLYKYSYSNSSSETKTVDPYWTLAGDIGLITQSGIFTATHEGVGYLIASFEGSVEYITIAVTSEASKTSPSVPAGLTISNISSGLVLVSWNASSYATSYFVRYHINPITLDGSSAYTTTSSVLLTGLSPNTTYYFQVKASNDYGSSRYCSAESFKTGN